MACRGRHSWDIELNPVDMQQAALRVLIVGGDSPSLQRHGALLRQRGLDVRVEDSAAEALGALNSFAPELLLLEVRDASEDDANLIRQTRGAVSQQDLPVLLLTPQAGSEAQRRMSSLGCGGDLFLTKPVDTDYLLSIVLARAREFRRMGETHQALSHSLRDLERQRQVLDAHAVVSMTDARGVITYANERFCQVSGYSRGELIGNTHGILKSGMHLDSFYQEMWKTIASGRTWQGEICNRSKQGSLIWVNATIMPFLDEQGQPRQYISIRTEITEQKLQQQRLAESEQRFRRLADSAPVLIWMADSRGGGTYFNRTWLSFTGRFLEQEQGMGWFGGVHPEDREALLQLYDEAVKRQGEFDAEFRLRRHDGEYRWFSAHGQPRLNPEGGFEGYVGSCTDISAHVALRHQLQRVEERLIYALEGTGQGVWDWNLLTGEVHRSAQWRAMLGYGDGDAAGDRGGVDVDMHPDDREHYALDLTRHLRGETRIFENAHRLRCKDGSYIWMLSRGKLVSRDAEDRPARMVGTDTDISARKSAETQLLRMRDIAAEIRDIQSRFIAGEARDTIFASILEAILRFSGSPLGFVAELVRDGDGAPYLRTNAISDIAWDEDSRRRFRVSGGMEFRNLDNLLGQVIQTGIVVIANNPVGDPWRGGLPFGHPVVKRSLGLPIHRGEELVGMVGLANRAEDYDQLLVEELQPLLATYATIVVAVRSENRRQQAETALQMLNAELEARVDKRTRELAASYSQLQEEEQFQRALFEIAPVGLALFRISDGCLLDCNPAFARILEFPMEDLVGRIYHDLVLSDKRATGPGEFEILRQSGSLRGHETNYRTRSGVQVPVRQSLRLVERKGVPMAWLVAEDIRERQRRDAVTDHLTRRIATLTGQQLFDAVCTSLSQLLGAEQVFIGRALPEWGSIRVLAWKIGEDWGAPNSHFHGGALFDAVTSSGELICHERVQELFPDQLWLRAREVNSFVALPLTDSSGATMGVLGAMSRAPFALPRGELISMLQLFAVRVRSEMQRIGAEQRFHDLFQFSPEAIVLADGEGRIRQVNEAAPRLFGYGPVEMAGRGVEELLPAELRQRHMGYRQDYMKRSMPRMMAFDRKAELRGQRRDGSTFPLEVSLVPVETEQGRWVAAVMRDISERTEAQQKIQASLREKETLLKEIHHRVKNNLQIIVSLLDMQAERLALGAARNALLDSQHRVRSMALIHERLYRNDDLGGVDFGEYLQSLVRVLYRSYQVDGCQVKLELDLDSIRLNIDTAVPCGLLINEMVTNAFKHAFHGRKEGQLRVSLKEVGGEVLLTVADDGPGIPAGFDWKKSDSLGAMLIHTLSRQIKAAMTIFGPPGTVYTLKFKELRYAPR